MIILGLVLFVIGLLAKIAILETIGLVVLVIGVVLMVLGSTGRAVAGRRHYW
jgi:membrane-bound ClpP family serine protease